MSPPAVSIPYMVISINFSHFLELLSAGQIISLNLENWTMLHEAHWRCSGTFQNLNIPHHASIAQENDEQLTCNAIMGCCTIECIEHVILSNQLSTYMINNSSIHLCWNKPCAEMTVLPSTSESFLVAKMIYDRSWVWPLIMRNCLLLHLIHLVPPDTC